MCCRRKVILDVNEFFFFVLGFHSLVCNFMGPKLTVSFINYSYVISLNEKKTNGQTFRWIRNELIRFFRKKNNSNVERDFSTIHKHIEIFHIESGWKSIIENFIFLPEDLKLHFHLQICENFVFYWLFNIGWD